MAERPPLPPLFQRMTDGINNATKKLTEQSHAIRRHEGWLPPEEIEEREADTMRRMFQLQRHVHSQANPMPFSAIDMIAITRSQG